MYDLAVIGAGPAGCSAAAAAAGLGLKTLVIEKEGFPRDKVCSGLIVSKLARETARRVFAGWPPEDIFHKKLKGFALHVNTKPPRLLDWPMPAYRRRDLDSWMLDRAVESGAETIRSAEFISLDLAENGYRITCRTKQGFTGYTAAGVVGADGAASRVREKLYPGLKAEYAYGYQQVVRGKSDLDPDYFHLFTNAAIAPYYVSLHYKQQDIVFEAGGPLKEFMNIRNWGLDLLKSKFGLQVEAVVFEKGCREPLLYGSWFGGQSLQGKGGVLLAGDAAGLVVPMSGEGIGLALYSGACAAGAFAVRGEEYAGNYIKEIRDKIVWLRESYLGVREVKKSAAGGEEKLLNTWEKVWRSTLEQW